MKDLYKQLEEFAAQNPSFELFKIHSVNGRKITISSFDNKDQSCETQFKKEGFLILHTNF